MCGCSCLYRAWKSPPNFSRLVREELGVCADACGYQRFSMAYDPHGSVSPASGSRRPPIYVAASSARLRESTNREQLTAWVRLLATLWLWRGLRRRSSRTCRHILNWIFEKS